MLVPSCKTAAVWMALRLRDEIGTEAFVEGYRRFGFETYADSVPMDTVPDFWRTESEAWQRRMAPAESRIRISEETGPAEWAQLAIGQGPIDATVIGVSRFIHAIANGGVMVRPSIERDQAMGSRGGERVMSEQTATRLQQAMREVVERGTGRAVETILQGTGWRMGGKTGTAQVPGRADNGWFAGILFSPDGFARYTIVSFLDGGGPGGSMPATIAGRTALEVIEEVPSFKRGS
jgi:cell division protein FtsI/penicillin-binding protein 2